MEKFRSADGPSPSEKLRAKALLLRMNRLERAVIPKDASSAVQAFRDSSREQYRKWMGVNVDDRENLRSGLEDIVAGVRASVVEVIAEINAGTFRQRGTPAAAESQAELDEWL